MTFGEYQASLEADYKRGNATEHTYRGTLKALLESQFPGIVATNEPKRIKAGAPDYVISRGETPLGHVEATAPGAAERMTKDCFKVDGAPLGKGNPKWLNDDYVEFIRLSRWRVDKTEYGILAFVTNHGYPVT